MRYASAPNVRSPSAVAWQPSKLSRASATQAWYGSKQREHRATLSLDSDNISLRGIPSRHSRSGSQGGASPSASRQRPPSGYPEQHSHGSSSGSVEQQLRRAQRQQQQAGVPPELRATPPSSRRGTDDAARRALIAHLQEVQAFCSPAAAVAAASTPLLMQCNAENVRRGPGTANS